MFWALESFRGYSVISINGSEILRSQLYNLVIDSLYMVWIKFGVIRPHRLKENNVLFKLVAMTIGIDNIGFSINIISELVFAIILHFFLIHILLEDEYLGFFTYIFFIDPQLIFLA